MSAVEDALDQALGRDYLVALMRYLPACDESALAQAYEIGRTSIENGVSLQDLIHVHHAALVRVTADRRSDECGQVIENAGEFLAEVLGAAELAQRAVRDRD